MLNIVASKAPEPNTSLNEVPRSEAQSNLDWFASRAPVNETVEILLLGGSGHTDFRLRIAQAHARHDLSPSHFSHAALVAPRAADLGTTPLYEVSLTPSRGFGFPSPHNGIQVGHLGAYADARAYPNIALICVPCTWETVEQHLDRLRKQRSAVDLPELILAWLAFTWGAGKAGNPLLDGRGIPSSTLVESVLGASGVNLSPGSVQGASCPELIWQAAKWWQDFYSGDGSKPLSGAYYTPHRFLDGE